MAKITVEINRCKGCSLCVVTCPQKIIALSSDLNAVGDRYAVQINQGKCTGCKFCAMICPDAAISVYR